MSLNRPVFEIVTTTTGAVSIRNNVVNEIMHNPVGPWAEANALYIDQSKLRERLIESDDELVVFDVGLGAAANALATLACADSLKEKCRPVRLVSFEVDLELLRFALEHSKAFAHFEGYEAAIHQILTTGRCHRGQITWELRHGNFLELIDREPHLAHLVFFDPYSPKQNEEMWGTSCFKKLRAKSREANEGGTELFTYSRSTRIRTALLLAGFHVGKGQATGLKDETTQASTDLARLSHPLGKDWLIRWSKSHLRYPFDCAAVDEEACARAVTRYFDRLGHSV